MEHQIIWAKPSHDHHDGKGFIVLCEILNNEVPLYVTWQTQSLDSNVQRFKGNYHRSFSSAKEEFLNR